MFGRFLRVLCMGNTVEDVTVVLMYGEKIFT